MALLIKGGRVVDPGHLDDRRDVFIDQGKIVAIVDPEKPPAPLPWQGRGPDALRVVEAAGKIIAPGLVDMHVHLREPGHEYKETIASGCRAAAAGGFTAVAAMPNTTPVNDNGQVTRFILEKAALAGSARVCPVGAISRGLAGKALCEYGELKAAGAVAVSDDGRPVENTLLMRRAMEYAKVFDLLVISHSEDLYLAAGGAMNEGAMATRLGLAGIPNAAESVMVARDIALCELTGARLHIAHVSTRQSVDQIRLAKRRGLPVTAETAPHYFTLTEQAVALYNTHAKMNPPLRSAADREAVRWALADGTIDVIATDHAPHSVLEKDVEFEQAANGIIGLETSLGLSLGLVKDGVLTLTQLLEKMAINPARLLGLGSGLRTGAAAHLTLIDPLAAYTVKADEFVSLSRNTPFDGMTLHGRAVMTLVEGRVVFQSPHDPV
jgi:dihydroorotase